MSKARMEAFTDAVLAIIITIMVLEIKVPHGVELTALRPLIPVFLSYALSFLYLGIYWSNHHHMLFVAHGVNGAILWANLHLVFWLSLVPFVTSWMGENHLAPAPTAAYGVILLLAAIAYLLLQQAILRQEGPGSTLALAVGRDRKGKLSSLLYALAIPVAFLRPWMAATLYVAGAMMWMVPDRRIERAVSQAGPEVSRP
jgi:TMEM175 potassium channel family protein